MENGKLRVAGLYEDHEMIDRLLRGDKVRRTQTTGPVNAYSLKVEREPFAPVIRELAGRLELEVEFTPGLEERLTDFVSFQVKDASLKELLDGACQVWRCPLSTGKGRSYGSCRSHARIVLLANPPLPPSR